MTFKDQLVAFLAGGDFTDAIYDQVYNDFADSIPYGTLTGDDDTLDNWIFDNQDEIIDFYDLRTHAFLIEDPDFGTKNNNQK